MIDIRHLLLIYKYTKTIKLTNYSHLFPVVSSMSLTEPSGAASRKYDCTEILSATLHYGVLIVHSTLPLMIYIF